MYIRSRRREDEPLITKKERDNVLELHIETKKALPGACRAEDRAETKKSAAPESFPRISGLARAERRASPSAADP